MGVGVITEGFKVCLSCESEVIHITAEEASLSFIVSENMDHRLPRDIWQQHGPKTHYLPGFWHQPVPWISAWSPVAVWPTGMKMAAQVMDIHMTFGANMGHGHSYDLWC